MKRSVVIALASIVVAVAVGGYLIVRGKRPIDGKKTAPAAIDAGPEEEREPTPRAERRDPDRAEPRIERDDDPAGSLRLEGQVIDGAEAPVGGAVVVVSSYPPRQIETEGDGSFAFDGLLAREYTLVAWKGDDHAGPVTARLSGKSEPVILRMKPGAALEVTVLDASTRKGIANADVEVRGAADRVARTGGDGKARIGGLASGWASLHARAPGYAPATRTINLSARGTAVERQELELVPGAPVSGRVVDGTGRPIAGARVTAERASDLFATVDPRRDGVVTDEKGEWTFPALAAGAFRFRATHEKYAPGHSETITLSGIATIRDVVIRLEAGASISGRVVDRQGAPVPLATVRAAAAGDGFDWNVTRQRVCDDRGAFLLEGLPRVPLELVASHESASSSVVRVDLVEKAHVADLVITLDIDGVISGIVVTPSGEPIPEAQVRAIADVMSGKFSMSDWRLRGTFTDVTDSGGRFTLSGVPAGTYDVRASRSTSVDRSAFFLGSGAKVSAGDTNVRIVLESDGAIKGKVQLPDGKPPELFTARIAGAAPTPFSGEGGAFQLDGLPPGTHTLFLNGPGFLEKLVEGVKVPAGGEIDLGTIRVEVGRSVSGRVLDDRGAPVAGATVLAGEQILGTGEALQAAFAQGGGVKEATSDADGSYALSGVGDKALALVADHKERGRSATIQLPPSRESVRIDLTLLAPGTLEGKVTRAGAPVSQAIVVAVPKAASREQFIATSGADGGYRFDRLAPDVYSVAAMIQGGQMFGMTRESVTATVRAGETTRADIALPTGGARVSVRVTQAGVATKSAQVVLVEGEIRVANVEALQEVAGSATDGTLKVDLINESTPNGTIVFTEVPPGRYTVCAVGLPGDIMNPETLEALQRNPNVLPLACNGFTLEASATEASVTVDLPKATERPGQPPRSPGR